MSDTFTEGGLLAALREKHSDPGNGGSGRYAFLTHVRTGGGHYQQEIDAVVVALWPSENHYIHAFEVKCSRTDWLREVKPDTSKSAKTRDLADTFTIVAPKGTVHDGELPEGWGLIEATWYTHFSDDENDDGVQRIRLRTFRRPANPPPSRTFPPIPRGLVVAMLRASGAVPGMSTGERRKAVR